MGHTKYPVFPTSLRGLESLKIQIQPIHIQDHRYVILVPDISNGDGRQATSTFSNRPAEEQRRFHDDVTSRSSTTHLCPPQDMQLPTLVGTRMPEHALTNQSAREGSSWHHSQLPRYKFHRAEFCTHQNTSLMILQGIPNSRDAQVCLFF